MKEINAQQFLSPSAAVPTGKAPGIKVRLLAENSGVKSYVVIFGKDDEFLSGVTAFAKQYNLTSGTFTAIGAFKDVTVAWFDSKIKMYKLIPIKEQVELVSMIGNIALSNGQPVVHSHISLGLADGTVQGGHLIEAHVFPTVELFVTAYPAVLQKELDEETGLKLMNP